MNVSVFYVHMMYSPLFSTLLSPPLIPSPISLSSPIPLPSSFLHVLPPPLLSPQVQMAAWTAKNGPMSVAAYALPWKHYKSGILTSGCR